MNDDVRSGFTRRDFIRQTTAAAAAAVILTHTDKLACADPAAKSRVVLVRDEFVLDPEGKIDASLLGLMLDNAVTRLLNVPSPLSAWKKLVQPADVVGVKTNIWRPLPTPKELEQHIHKRLLEIGLENRNISFDDQGVLDNPVFKRATALINARPMRSHHWCGVSGCIKNMIMFAPYPPDYHNDSCADLAKLFQLPLVKNKTRLHILVLLTPLYHGKGPHHFQKQYTWQYKGLLVSQDPVAADAVGLKILEAKRRQVFQNDEPFIVSPKHIRLADERHHLGNAKMENIELIKLGWGEGILI